MKNIKKNVKLHLTVLIALILAVILTFTVCGNIFKGVNAATAPVTTYEFKGYSNGMLEDDLHEATKMGDATDDAPSITVLVHGQGGKASHWSNGGEDNGYEFKNEKDSIINKLDQYANGINLYWAKFYNSSSDFKFYLFDLQFCGDDYQTEFINWNKASDVNKGSCNIKPLSVIKDISKHTVIVFESAHSTGYHREVYKELHTLLDKVSYDYLVLTGKLPKINLISHSRGGITSMMYATGYLEKGAIATSEYITKKEYDVLPETDKKGYVKKGDEMYQKETGFEKEGKLILDHPYNVAGLYSMGTPYSGTSWDTKFFGVAHSLLGSSFGNNSAQDILNEDIQAELKYCWGKAVSENTDLTLHAMAGEMAPNFIVGFLAEEAKAIITLIKNEFNVSDDLFDKIELGAKIVSALIVPVNGLITLFENILLGLEMGVSLSIPVFGVVVGLVLTTATVAAMESLRVVVNKIANKINLIQLMYLGETDFDPETLFVLLSDGISFLFDLVTAYNNLVTCLTYDSEFNVIGELGDLFIDKPSQTAENFPNVVTYSKVFGYKKFSYKIEGGQYVFKYEEGDPNFKFKKSTADPGIPHNLETHDEDIIYYITSNIQLAKPELRYNTETLKDGTLSITGLKADGTFNNSKIVIPEEIDGKEITEIGEKAFQGKTQIAEVEISKNIKAIEDYAFADATSLDTVTLKEGLLKIGRYAFSNIGLSKLNNAADNSDEGKNKTEVKVEIPNSVEEIWSNAFARNIDEGGANNNYNDIKEIIVTLTDETNSKLRYVGENAFSGLNITRLGPVLIKYSDDSDGNDLVLDKNSIIKYFAEKCFEGSKLESLDVSGFEFGNQTIPEFFLYGAENLSYVTLPDDIKIIGGSAFAGTANLKTLNLPDSVEVIGIEAFQNSAVKELTVSSAYPPTISPDTFDKNDGLITVYVKRYAVHDFETFWGEGFNFDSHKANLKFFDGKDLTSKKINNDIVYYSTELYKSSDVYYYDYIEDEWTSFDYSKAGYTFLGWYDKNNNVYYKGSLIEFELNESWELTAYWRPNVYNIFYDTDGGKSGNRNTITVLDDEILSDCVKTGYTFDGWYDNADFHGLAINKLSNISYDIKLYARFTPINVQVTYYSDGIQLTKSTDILSYGERFFAPVPQKECYAFAGWYMGINGQGERITGTNGVSLKKCEFLNDTVLYAFWTPKSFVLEFINGETRMVYGDGSLTSGVSSVLATQEINLNDKSFIDLFRRDGYIFKEFQDESGKIIDFQHGVPDLGKNFSTFVIRPTLEKEIYSFNLFDQGHIFKTVVKQFEDEYDFSISKNGYEFVGWADERGNIILDEQKGFIVKDFTPDSEKNGIVNLYATWTPLVGNLSFDSTGGSKVTLLNGYKAEYDKCLNTIKIPERLGYDFVGFYDSDNKQYINRDGNGSRVWDKTDTYVTLYAKWSLKRFQVNYVYNNFEENNGINCEYFNVEAEADFPTNLKKSGYTFGGWYTDPACNAKSIKNTRGIYKNLTVYAKWIENSYSIVSQTYITISTDNRLIKLDTINTTKSYHFITLSSNVTSILLSGKATKNISFICQAPNIKISLLNASFTGVEDNHAIKARNIDVRAVGNSTIIGGCGSDGADGYNRYKNTNHGTPSNGSTRAGNGDNGGHGADGKEGKPAIYAEQSLKLYGNVSLTLIGGYGGNGGRGGRGGHGADGANGAKGGGKDNGVSGGHGGYGGNGGRGGNGASAVKCNYFESNLVNLNLTTGNGGNGGYGGNGGNGGNGGKGADNSGFLCFASNYAGDGGNGGDAGRCGNGGMRGLKGNNAIIANYIGSGEYKQEHSFDGHSGKSGSNGSVGEGGKGGNGPIGGNDGVKGRAVT